MSSRKFEFDIISQSNAIVTWIILVIILMAMAVSGISFEGMGASIIVVVLGALFINRTSSVKTQWTLDDKGVWVSFLTQGSFVSKPDQGWSWDEIADVELFQERRYEGFKLKFIEGNSRKYYVNTKGEAYENFIEAIQLQFGDIKWRRPPEGIITDMSEVNNG